ncbi:MAG TPA: autotransporter outer membrane beta-barrel domain-containing protein [Stellaceae bacterium]|nr:autotransporter outer membrane beta-barrel domain-containing protein [Stellaceae bacterium]
MRALGAISRVLGAGLISAAAGFIWNPCHAQTLGPFSDTSGVVALPGLNSSQFAMAQSINNVCPTISQSSVFTTPGQHDLANICTAMIVNSLQVENMPTPAGAPSFGLGAGGLANALSQLNGGTELVVPTSQASTLQNMQYNLQTGVIEARLSMLRDRLMTGRAFASGDSPQAVQFAAAGAPDAIRYTQVAQAPPPLNLSAWNGRLGLFLTGIGQFGDRDTTANENGYSFDNAGFVGGADYFFTPRLVGGAAFSYTRANTNFDTSATSPAGQFLRGDNFQGNIYATYAATSALYFNGIATIGGSDNFSRRVVVIPSFSPTMAAVNRAASGSFGGRNYAGSLGAGYNMPFGAWVVTPTARFQYTYARADSFTENGGSGVDLTYGSSHYNAAQSFIGGQVSYTMTTAWGPLLPTGHFQWAHQYNSGNTAVSVAYSNDPLFLSNFSMPGDRTDRDYFDVGIGLTLTPAPNRSLYLTYDAILGLSHTTYNTLTGGIRIAF